MTSYIKYQNVPKISHTLLKQTMESREDLVFIAQLNENAERYDDMIETMKKIIALGDELNDKERNLLSVAYKNIIGPRRAAWRIVSTIETREKGRSKIN